MSVTLHVVGLWQYYVCCKRSGVTRCTLFMMLDLPALYVPDRVTGGAVISHRFTYALPSCRTSQHCRTFISLSVSLWNDLGDSVFDGVGVAGFKSRANAFFFSLLLALFLSHGTSRAPCNQYHSPKVTTLTNHAKGTDQGLCNCNSNSWGWHNSHQSGVSNITEQLIFQNVKKLGSGAYRSFIIMLFWLD